MSTSIRGKIKKKLKIYDTCRVCQRFPSDRNATDGIWGKKGFYCKSCLKKMPNCIRENPDNVDPYAIHIINTNSWGDKSLHSTYSLRPHISVGKMEYYPEEDTFYFSGRFFKRAVFYRIGFEDVVIKQEKDGVFNQVVCTIELNPAIKNHVFLRESIQIYFAPNGSKGKPWYRMMKALNAEKIKERQEQEQKERQEQERQRKAEEKNRREAEYARQQEAEQKRRESKKNKKEQEIAFGLKWFGLSPDFTEAELKKVYRRMQKEAHPDASSGNTDISARINATKDLLMEYLKKREEKERRDGRKMA